MTFFTPKLKNLKKKIVKEQQQKNNMKFEKK